MSVDFVEARQAGSPSGYKSTRGLTIAVLVLLGAQVLLRAVDVIGAQWVRSNMTDLDALTIYNALGTVETLLSLLFIATAVCFLCWMYRGYANLPSLGCERITATPKSAVVGWFIPFVNLVHGYKSTRDLYLDSQRPAVLPDGYILPTNAAIVGWWWGLYLSRNLGVRLVTAVIGVNGEGLTFWFLWTAVDIAAAVLCMMVVYRVDKRQRDQFDDLQRRAAVPLPTGDSLR